MYTFETAALSGMFTDMWTPSFRAAITSDFALAHALSEYINSMGRLVYSLLPTRMDVSRQLLARYGISTLSPRARQRVFR